MDEIFESEQLERELDDAASADPRATIARRIARLAVTSAPARGDLLGVARARATQRHGVWMPAARRTALVAASIAMLGGTTVAVAAHDAEPGSMLHPLRQVGHAVVTMFTGDDTSSDTDTDPTTSDPAPEPTDLPTPEATDGPDDDQGRGNDRHDESEEDDDRGQGNDDRDDEDDSDDDHGRGNDDDDEGDDNGNRGRGSDDSDDDDDHGRGNDDDDDLPDDDDHDDDQDTQDTQDTDDEDESDDSDD